MRFAALEACGAPVDKLQVEAGAPGWYHPGRSGVIKLGPKTVLGTFGEFHPKTLEILDVSGPLCGFEVYVDAVPEPKAKPTRTKPRLDLSAFQAGEARLRLRGRQGGRGRHAHQGGARPPTGS